MPACVAHHQFGHDVLPRLDDSLRSRVIAYEREYDIGLQGPDLFFYYKPYRKNDVVDYGHARHKEPAIRMFASILAEKREGAAFSYMVGLICHHTLDAACHPYIDNHISDDSGHHRMEASYDRHIMQERKTVESRHLLAHVDGLDYVAMASLWPGMDVRTIEDCARSRRLYMLLLDQPGIVSVVETLALRRGAASPLSLPATVPSEQREHMDKLDELYQKALIECPEKITRACGAMGTRIAELPGFEMNYGGETHA